MGKKRVQVVGGGFSGLAVAYFLVKEGHEVRLVEEAGHFGGMLQTIPTPFGIVERAANALLANALVEETAADLGIELVPTLPSARKRFIFKRGRPRRWPLSGAASVRFLTETMPKFFLARRSFLPHEGESVRAWGDRCLGAEATDSLLIPALSGVYAGRAEHLSASLILSRFFGSTGRIPRGKLKGSVAPRQGMGEWGKGFSRWLKEKGVEFAKVPEEGIATIVALPPPKAKEFLGGRAPKLAEHLGRVEMLSLVSVTCFLPDSAPGLDGFGCLFPRSEGIRPLGVLANEKIFPNRALKGWRSETWIFGGATDPGASQLTDQNLYSSIYHARQAIHGEKFDGIEHGQVCRWPAAIPHYNLQLEKILANSPRAEGNYALFGTYLGDLGLARVLVRAQDMARSFP